MGMCFVLKLAQIKEGKASPYIFLCPPSLIRGFSAHILDEHFNFMFSRLDGSIYSLGLNAPAPESGVK